MISNSCYYQNSDCNKTFLTLYPIKSTNEVRYSRLLHSSLKNIINVIPFVVSHNSNVTVSSKGFSVSKEKGKNLEKLNKINQLTDNWNGYGAKPISNEIIQEVRTIITELNYQPEIFPLPDNEIQIEFDGPNHSYMEIHIGTKDLVNAFVIDSSGDEVEKVLSKKSIISEVNSFYG